MDYKIPVRNSPRSGMVEENETDKSLTNCVKAIRQVVVRRLNIEEIIAGLDQTSKFAN